MAALGWPWRVAAAAWVLNLVLLVLLLEKWTGETQSAPREDPAERCVATHAGRFDGIDVCEPALERARADVATCELSRQLGLEAYPSPATAGLPWWITPEVLHSKLFSAALPPVRVLPNFFRSAPDHAGRRDLRTRRPATFSVVTMLTLDRLPALERLCKRWAGPISAAVHLDPAELSTESKAGAPDSSNHLTDAVPVAVEHLARQLAALDATSDGCALNVHLILDRQPVVQLNLWRNVARLYASTPYHVMLDVDFVPDAGLRVALEDERDGWASWLNDGRVLVLPAFELISGDDGEPAPGVEEVMALETVEQLLDLWARRRAAMFHPAWFHGQGHTNYARWRTATAPYRPDTYHVKWEPYVVSGPATPWCDEGFVGFGSNKCACVLELFMAGIEFWVLPRHFIVHQPHPTGGARTGSEVRRTRENELNERTLRRFMETLEVKYHRHAPYVAAQPHLAVTVAQPDATVAPPERWDADF